MSKLTDYILEKVSKTEIEEALNNPNIRIGCEFEFYADPEYFLDRFMSNDNNPWYDWIEQAEEYNEEVKSYVERVQEWRRKLDKWSLEKETQTELFDDDLSPEPEEPTDTPTLSYDLDRQLWRFRDQDYYNKNGVKLFNLKLMEIEQDEWSPPMDAEAIREEVFRMLKEDHGMPKDWDYGDDGSLSEYDTDIEIATTPMTMKEFLVVCPKMFEIIEEIGIVTDKCGFHVGISLSNVPDLEKALDVVKLAMFTDEEYIYKFFSGREDNTYVRSVHDQILSGYIITPSSFEDLIDTGKLGREYSKTHYNAINHEHLSQDNKYIEFRYMGGQNYHQKWPKIKTIIAQYAHNMVLACDPEYKKKEYMLKIQRVLNKIDFQAKKELEREMLNALRTANPAQKKFLNLKLAKINKVIAHLDAKPDMRLDQTADRLASEWWDRDIKPEMVKLGKNEIGNDIVAEYFALKEFHDRWKHWIGQISTKARDYFWSMNKRREDLERNDMPRSIPYNSRGEMDKIYDEMDRKMKSLMAESTITGEEPMLTEKVSKRDVDIALSNKNVLIGFEIEMIVPTFTEKYGKAAKMWVEWDRYGQQYDAWESSTDEYLAAGMEEGYDPPSLPEWAYELGYEDGEDSLPNPTELFDLPELDIEKFFDLVIAEFLPLDKLPFTNMIIDHDNTRKSTTQWVIKPDATLGPAGVEIVSPILTIDEYLEMCPKMFDYVEKYGTTDDSCGFHISISLKNVPDLSKSLDVVKMALFLEEDYIYNFFKKRRDNDYARSAHKAVLSGANARDFDDFIKSTIDIQKLKKAIPDTHYEAINIEHLTDTPAKQYIEFRYLGSGDYHKKWKEIKTITAHYIWALSVGNDPEYMKKEYMLKLQRIMNKHELFAIKLEMYMMKFRYHKGKGMSFSADKFEALSKEAKKLQGMGIKIGPKEA